MDAGESVTTTRYDGDGLDDHLEDANLNGIIDEGETNPRHVDLTLMGPVMHKNIS